METSGQDELVARSDAEGQVVETDDLVLPRDRRESATVRMRRAAHRLLVWVGSVAAAMILVIEFSLWRFP